MKAIQISQPQITTTRTSGVAADNISHLPAAQYLTTATPEPKLLKTVIDVLAEGLKQNFLGQDINMEYLSLTVRSYASSTIKTIQHLVKPLSFKHHVHTTQRQLNQPTC